MIDMSGVVSGYLDRGRGGFGDIYWIVWYMMDALCLSHVPLASESLLFSLDEKSRQKNQLLRFQALKSLLAA